MGIECCYDEIIEKFICMDSNNNKMDVQETCTDNAWILQKEDIKWLYEKIIPLLNNPSEGFESVTISILSSLKHPKEVYSKWDMMAKNLFGSSLVVKLMENKDISLDEAKKFLAFFENNQLVNEVKVCGVFATAQTQKINEPMFCYLNSMKTFQICQNSGEILGLNYRYDELKLNNVIFDSCPICGSERSIPIYCDLQANIIEGDNRFAPVKLWKKCSDCTNIYAYNFPIMHMENINGHFTRRDHILKIEPKFNMSLYNPIFQGFKELSSGNKYLEIGIGNGDMLAAALEWGYDVRAIEVCREDCENVSAALNIDIYWCDFVKYESSEKFDVIVMGDVLEHVSNPVIALEKAVDMLNAEGVLWISTPNYNSAYARMQKWDHCMWHQKNHFTYFSYEGLVRILDKLELEVKQYRMSDRYMGSMELFVKKTNQKHI